MTPKLEAGSPAAIFFKCLDRIERTLKKAKRAKAFKDEAAANALRTELFKLEGWAKIHRHWADKKELKVFSHIREQTKELEDALGAVDSAKAVAADLISKNQTEAAELFNERAKKAHKELKEVLKSRHWLVKSSDEESRVEKMRRQLEDIGWPSADMHVDYLQQALGKELLALNEKYRSVLKPVLVGERYDRKMTELSLHELRRQLRWVAIYFQTADGLFALGPLSRMLTNEKRQLVGEFQDHKFAQLPEKKSTRVLIDRVAFYELTRLIQNLGVVKDRAEKYFSLHDCLVKNGATDAAASERARALYSDVPRETPLATHKILAEFDRFKPLAYLAESVQ